eukprot:TRINITY_DN30670_c0_g1_i1.p1 TRINITY_DN30670_c0_g1~~TRINITY_DN30670_c0_g1_i1.p1  ORF type:complete len:345 (+),score=50.09 TRINITY_DN30670_c0_g1_i1:40-1074(+)
MVYNPEEIIVQEHGCRNVETLESPYTETSKKDRSQIKDDPKIKILKKWRSSRKDVGEKEDEIDFELRGTSPAIANLLRRTMMMEIPTVAIDIVLIHYNDGVVFDEALSHRLGLIPLDVDANLLKRTTTSVDPANPDATSVIKFTLDVTATRDNYQVYSSDLKYQPLSGCPAFATPPKPVHDKILIAKLAKGHRVKVTCFAIVGTGALHAKWSPVGTATYKPIPIVRPKPSIPIAEAEFIKNRCAANVFDIEDGHLIAKNPTECTMCRECIRSDIDLSAKHVDLGLEKNNFLFHVESVGVYPAQEIVTRAMRIYATHLRNLATQVRYAWPSTIVECTDPGQEDYL